MKFMVTWKLRPESRTDCARFARITPEEERKAWEGQISLIGRWHDPIRRTGVLICESDNAEALSRWALDWNSGIDLDIAPVLDDAEIKALGQRRADKA